MESLLSVALSNAIVATLLAAIVAVAARVCRRPIVVHALWLLVLLKLLTPPLIVVPMAWPQTTDPMALSQEDSVIDLPALPEESVSSEVDPLPAIPPPIVSWEIVVVTLWLMGSLAWWTIAGVRLICFHRLLREARSVPETVQEQGRRLAALLGLRRCPPISFVSAPLSPMLWALGFSPRLLVPAILWNRLNAEQQDTLLAHELAHLRRGDHWVRRLEYIVLGLYWWYPIVWWARRRLQEAEEECCDARVVSILPDSAPAYASALIETVTFLSQTRAAALVGASGAGQVPLLKRRLTMILTATPSGRWSRAGFWIVLGLGALLLPITPGAGQTEPPAQPARAESERQPSDKERQITRVAGQWLFTHGMENCASCHQEPVHSRDLQQKPQSWKKAHDESVRLWDEARRKQAQLRDAANRLPAATERERAEQIEKLQDEIELLKVQVKVKEALIQAEKAPLEESQLRRQHMQRLSRSNPGAVSQEEVRANELKIETHTVQIRIKEAELMEPLVRLKQAERRLTRLQRPTERPAVGGHEQQEQRLRELEQKVNQILDEMKALERQLHPRKPGEVPKP